MIQEKKRGRFCAAGTLRWHDFAGQTFFFTSRDSWSTWRHRQDGFKVHAFLCRRKTVHGSIIYDDVTTCRTPPYVTRWPPNDPPHPSVGIRSNIFTIFYWPFGESLTLVLYVNVQLKQKEKDHHCLMFIKGRFLLLFLGREDGDGYSVKLSSSSAYASVCIQSSANLPKGWQYLMWTGGMDGVGVAVSRGR